MEFSCKIVAISAAGMYKIAVTDMTAIFHTSKSVIMAGVTRPDYFDVHFKGNIVQSQFKRVRVGTDSENNFAIFDGGVIFHSEIKVEEKISKPE